MKRLFAIIAVLLVVPALAMADDMTVADADDSAGRLDIRSVEVTHPDSGTIRFTITFYEPHQFSPSDDEYEPGDSIRISMRVGGKGPGRHKEIQLRANPDGSLYGVLRTFEGPDASYVRAWRVDGFSVAVDVKRKQLKRRRLAERADWFVSTHYLDFDVCQAEGGDVPRSCNDGSPEGRYQRHDL